MIYRTKQTYIFFCNWYTEHHFIWVSTHHSIWLLTQWRVREKVVPQLRGALRCTYAQS